MRGGMGGCMGGCMGAGQGLGSAEEVSTAPPTYLGQPTTRPHTARRFCWAPLRRIAEAANFLSFLDETVRVRLDVGNPEARQHLGIGTSSTRWLLGELVALDIIC